RNDVIDTSSRTTITTGVVESVLIAAAATSEPNAMSRAGDSTRKSRSTTIGAGDSHVANDRSPGERAYATAAPAPVSTAAAIIGTVPQSPAFLNSWAAIRPTSSATSGRCSRPPASASAPAASNG